MFDREVLACTKATQIEVGRRGEEQRRPAPTHQPPDVGVNGGVSADEPMPPDGVYAVASRAWRHFG